MKTKILAIATALTVVLGISFAQSTEPSHPLSHIDPIDIDFDMFGQDIHNTTYVNTTRIAPENEDLVFQDTGGSDIMEWSSQETQWNILTQLNVTGTLYSHDQIETETVTSQERLCIGNECN